MFSRLTLTVQSQAPARSRLHADGRYELTKMAVDTRFRGKGVGQHLMTAVESLRQRMT